MPFLPPTLFFSTSFLILLVEAGREGCRLEKEEREGGRSATRISAPLGRARKAEEEDEGKGRSHTAAIGAKC